mmetsp:Transcript_22183/g.25671  ORF Transcript_22183/g.25671 Transcript_22183/m.25671 type:complete len:218 (-) Transcript_22183:270-923(-)
MSRAFHPPDTLSKDDVRKIADVRRDVWTSGFKGLFYGSAAGYTLHTASKFFYNRVLSEKNKSKIRAAFDINKSKPIFTRNTAFLSFMLGGSLGSFLLATTTGKNEVHELHDIFHIGEKEKPLTPYQRSIENAKKVGGDYNNDTSFDRKRRRLSRRKTRADRLQKGRGLSDSHSGHWLEEDETTTMTQQNRSSRRQNMTKRLEEGRGLSDSHSGKWES